VIFRGVGTVGNNTLENLVVRTTDTSFGTRLVVNQPHTTLENVVVETKVHKVAHLELEGGAAGTTVDGLRMEFPSTNRARAAAIRVKTGPVTLEDVEITDDTGDDTIRALQTDPEGGDIPSVTVDGLRTDIGRRWLRAMSSEYTTKRVRVDGFREVRSDGVRIPADTDCWYARDGHATESASADQPQGIYPNGTVVEFTDTGDGSGSGNYLVTPDGPLAL